MKRVQPSAAVTTNKRVKEEPEEEEETNGRHDEDLNAREPEEEEMNWRHDEDEGVSDHERSIATDPGQPLSANIPLHILETIFAHLSIQDIMNCSLVCARWSAICRREKFLFWKKSYLKVKRGKKWEEWGRENGIAISHPATMECLKDTTRFVQQVFVNKLLVDGGDEERVSTALSHHPQYTNVVGVLQRDKVLQHCKDSTLPATVSLLVMLSRDVFEVRRVFLLLTAPGSPCCLMRVVELFYCLATFFYKRWRQQVLPQRYHYKVCHVLTLFEQPSITAHREGAVSLTHEQSRIVNHPIKPADVVKVVAFAGTGKTTTLLHFALSHPNHKFLYLVYNKSVQVLASKLFPKSNVVCKTLHSLAFGHTGFSYRHKLTQSGTYEYNMPEFVVEGCNLKRPGNGKMTAYQLNQLASKTLEKFLASADDEIASSHLPDLSHKYHKIPDCIRGRIEELLVEQAKTIWEAMKDVKSKCQMTHDGYLKLFQLRRPHHQVTGYDCILIDESQDLTPAVIDILTHQTCPKIFVGDPHQQIYSFRGAVNAIDMIVPTHSYYLTKSFRFGPNIAFLASVMLSELKSVHQQTLTGGLQDGGYFGEHSKDHQLAVIARNNLTLLKGIFDILATSPKANIALAGGLPRFNFPTLEDVYYLKENRRDMIKSGRIKKFKSIFHLQNDAEFTEDLNLRIMFSICQSYADVPKYIELVHRNGVLKRDINEADIVFSTAHSAKGLEFHTVEIEDDFLEEAHSETGDFLPDRCAVDERNLLYVAVTRATHYVIMSTAVMEVLQLAREYPVLHCMPSSVAKSSDSCCNWMLCGLDDDDDTPEDPVIVPVKTRIPVHLLPDSCTDDSGPLCADCINVYYPELTPL